MQHTAVVPPRWLWCGGGRWDVSQGWGRSHVEFLQSILDSTEVAMDGFVALGQPTGGRAEVGLVGAGGVRV